MSAQEEFEVPEVSSHALHDLLADLNTSPSSGVQRPGLTSLRTEPWRFSSPQRTSSPQHNTRSSASLPRKSSSQENHSQPTPDLDPTAPFSSSTVFNTPSRSIFSSGPPTSSLSVNTAQASISGPSGISTYPLAALSGPNTPVRRVGRHFLSGTSTTPSSKSRLSRVEKDVDDPTSPRQDPLLADRRDGSSPTTISRLFTAPDPASPTVSRHASYKRTPSGTQYVRASASLEGASLPTHLYERGLISGRHSDITIHAFGNKYALHRLLLDRAPFFSSALSEPWYESSAKEITLYPEETDSNITQAAFELALKRIYGCPNVEEEDKEITGLFATGCWLDMAELIDASVNSISRQMSPATLAPFISFLTSNYYGRTGELLLDSAKAMLYREGYEMHPDYWVGISGDIIREIVGGDGFFVPGEWERWNLARKLFNRRLKARAIENGLVDSAGNVQKPPAMLNAMDVRKDFWDSKSATNSPWLILYAHPDIVALLKLLDQGIHYMHLTFEQLQKIRNQRDGLGTPLLPDNIASNALWMSMELRSNVLNRSEEDLELDLCQTYEERSESPSAVTLPDSTSTSPAKTKGKQAESNVPKEESDGESSEDISEEGKPMFWVPYADASYTIGGTVASIISNFTSKRPVLLRKQSPDIQEMHDKQKENFQKGGHLQTPDPDSIALNMDLSPTIPSEPCPKLCYTKYPPFRFAVDFPNLRALKSRKRVYSSTVWYAGSLWNVYVQKIESANHTELGIYLHRANYMETRGLVGHRITAPHDESVGDLEGLLLRHSSYMYHSRAMPFAWDSHIGRDLPDYNDDTLVDGSSHSTKLASLLRAHSTNVTKTSEARTNIPSSNDRNYGASTSKSNDEAAKNGIQAPALQPYVDTRSAIHTYFKIYAPSKSGRMLSVYESKPVKLKFCQSWGWRSTDLVIDDTIEGDEATLRKDGRLKFMVILGNI